MFFEHWLTLYANCFKYSDGENMTLSCLCSRLSSRWRHTTQRGRVTLARWLSSSQTQTDPAVPAGLSSEGESCPTASRWHGVSISYSLSFIPYSFIFLNELWPTVVKSARDRWSSMLRGQEIIDSSSWYSDKEVVSPQTSLDKHITHCSTGALPPVLRIKKVSWALKTFPSH